MTLIEDPSSAFLITPGKASSNLGMLVTLSSGTTNPFPYLCTVSVRNSNPKSSGFARIAFFSGMVKVLLFWVRKVDASATRSGSDSTAWSRAEGARVSCVEQSTFSHDRGRTRSLHPRMLPCVYVDGPPRRWVRRHVMHVQCHGVNMLCGNMLRY